MASASAARIEFLIEHLSDAGNFSELIPLIYRDLRRLAASHLRNDRGNRSLQATELANELLILWSQAGRRPHCTNRRQLFGAASNAMRHLLVDRVRRRQTAKRDVGRKVSLNGIDLPAPEPPDFLALHNALLEFENVDPRAGEIVELHIFGGMTFKEIASLLGLGESTVRNDWMCALRWFRVHQRDVE
jgi:RNA polymerase sigma factor (TIGR02999 family)